MIGRTRKPGERVVINPSDSALSPPSITPSALPFRVRTWEEDHVEELVAALRAYFLTHTLDPLTGEVHSVH